MLNNTKASAWHYFPWVVTGGMGVVIAVNAAMIWMAVATFPGKAGRDGFDLSNRYNAVLSKVEAQAELGWAVRALVDAERRPVLVLAGATERPLTGATIVATAQRPVGDATPIPVVFHEVVPGRYVADAALPMMGQWDLLLTANAEGQAYTTTHRIVVQ